ncbi:hypothetical protein F2Q70_00023094 [Brassica cretica]|uniref:BnaCnng63610D protein n=2 Tax=Brassica TaxID=3705 RepID=A0A078JV41_BRANA|nr:uncharacterized protein LOC111213061 [Brassica napus]KAF2546628.1 hypothetical protein F2Q70_00023094 [Brassica cretica]CDY69456.1 BnaCnng63610D [Brassica napus]
MARHLEDVISMATTTTQFHVSYLLHIVFLALFSCCVLSALLLSCADGASDNKATSGNTPSAGGCGGAGCGGGCGD